MNQIPDTYRRFVDDTGLLLEAAGMPRIAGQVLGWLLVCAYAPEGREAHA